MAKWIPAEARIDIAGITTHIKAPSKVQLRGGLNHLCHDSLLQFIQGVATVKDIKYVVDVGANIGATALMFHMAFPQARILALEPMKVNWDCLIYNTKNFRDIIKCLNTAAGREQGYIKLALPSLDQRPDIDEDMSGNSGLFTMFGKGGKSETAKVNKLDDIVDGPVDLLKIDVEGAEAEVLSGATRIMVEDRPIVFIEMRASNMRMAGHTVDEYNRYFKSLRYRDAGRYLDDHILIPAEHSLEEWQSVAKGLVSKGYGKCG